MNKQHILSRQRAREYALQALYQWLIAAQPMTDIDAQFRPFFKKDKVDEAYFSLLIQGVASHLDEVDASYEPFLDRKISALNPIEKSILRLSTFELQHCLDVPYRIILEEAVLLAKTFGAQDGFRYVNGVLNQLAKHVRAMEMNSLNE